MGVEQWLGRVREGGPTWLLQWLRWAGTSQHWLRPRRQANQHPSPCNHNGVSLLSLLRVVAAQKDCQFHSTEHPVYSYTFYLCDLNSLSQNALGYMLGRVNRSGLRSLEVTQSRDERPHHPPGGPGTTSERELLVSSLASHDLFSMSRALLVPGGLLCLQHHITQSEGGGRRKASPTTELHFAPTSLKVLCSSYHVRITRRAWQGWPWNY